MSEETTTALEEVFVSYSRERNAEAEQVRDHLPGAFVCHIDAPELEGRSRSAQKKALEKRIKEAVGVLVLWDRNYGRAAWCGWELAFAAKQGKPICLVALDSTAIPPRLKRRVQISSLTNVLMTSSCATTDSLDGAVLFPAASLLEPRHAPILDSWFPRWRELTTTYGLFVIAVLLQLLIYAVLAPLMVATPERVHLWAIFAAMNVAMCVIEAFTLSLSASIVSGVFVLLVGALVLLLSHEPNTHDIVTRTAGVGVLHASVALFVRDRILGESLVLAPPRFEIGDVLGHVWATLGVVLLAVLILLGIVALEAATDLVNQVQTGKVGYLEAFLRSKVITDLPLEVGALVGGMVGVALGTSTFRRVSARFRDSAQSRMSIAGVPAITITTLFLWGGYEVGAYVRDHVLEHPPIGVWGGVYAGGLIGVMLALGLVVPIAAGTGRLSPRQERWWGLFGVGVVIAMITWKIQSFPFARDRSDVTNGILVGVAYGATPLLLLRGGATLADSLRKRRSGSRGDRSTK